jgi:endonuclease IV
MIKIGIKIGPQSDLKEFEKTVPYADFIELYGKSGFDYSFVKKYKKPVVVHAPNFGQGINYANSCKEGANLASLTWAKETADFFGSDKIIVHAELIENDCSDIKNSINFLIKNFDKRIHIENMPYSSMGYRHIGAEPKEIREIIEKTGVNFCLDLSHAAEYAAFIKKDYEKVINELLSLKPNHFHLSDSNLEAVFKEDFDELHLNFFKGNIDLVGIKGLIPKDSWVTLETVNIFKEQIKEIEFLKGEKC